LWEKWGIGNCPLSPPTPKWQQFRKPEVDEFQQLSFNMMNLLQQSRKATMASSLKHNRLCLFQGVLRQQARSAVQGEERPALTQPVKSWSVLWTHCATSLRGNGTLQTNSHLMRHTAHPKSFCLPSLALQKFLGRHEKAERTSCFMKENKKYTCFYV